MNTPDEATWERVEALARNLESVAPEKLGEEIARLRVAGESATVLTLLSGWLALPPLPSGLAPGTEVGGRYTLRAKIGEGGMGSVWRARQEQVGRDVALKVIHPALATPDLRARFQKEIEVLALLDHPGIVKAFDAGIMDGTGQAEAPYLAMELVDGEPLDTWAARNRHDRSRLLKTAASVCLAIHTAHERRIVHRDLKPSNIIVKPNGQPVILDFGIASLAGIVTGDVGHQFSGTPQYAAPEQHHGSDRDFRSGESVDVYAMGAIVFEMLSGRRMFEFPPRTPLADIRKEVVEGKPRRLCDVLPDCPANLDDLVARSVRRNPADRFFSIAAFGRALTRAAESLDATKESAKPWQPAQGLTIPGTGWCLTERLGSGSTGEVWLGRHSGTDHVRVFKFCDSDEKVRSLKREATLFRLLKERVGRHPNLIQLHEVSLDEAPFYLMMEQCDAKELGLWCADQPGGLRGISEAVKIEIVAQAADALQAAHEAGILHRDIKPANLLIGNHPENGLVHVFVADFGIGQIVAEDLLRDGTLAGFTGTISGALSGSLRYMAPEVLEGNAATARSDIYCLGVVLWQLLVGNLNAALDPTGWDARIEDPLLRSDLARCLSGKPEQRWASAAEFAASLRALPNRRDAARKREAEMRAREKAAYRRGALRSAAIVAVVLSVVAVSLWIARKHFLDARDAKVEVQKSETRSTISSLTNLIEAHSGNTRKFLDKALQGDRLYRTGFEKELRDLAAAGLALPTFEPLDPPPLILGPADCFSSFGDYLAVATTNGLEQVELATGSRFPILAAPVSGHVRTVWPSQGGRAVAITDSAGVVAFAYGTNLSLRKIIPGLIHQGCFALSSSSVAGSTPVAVSRPGGNIDVYQYEDFASPALALTRHGSDGNRILPESTPATLLAFNHSKISILASAGPDSGFVLLWSIIGAEKAPFTGRFAGSLWHPDDILCLAWRPTANELATGGGDGVLRFWKPPPTAEPPQTVPFLETDLGEPVAALAWNNDGSLLAVLLKSGRIKVLCFVATEIRTVADLSHRGATEISFAAGDTLFAWGQTNGSKAWGAGPIFTRRYVGMGKVQVAFHKRGGLLAVAPDQIFVANPRTLARTKNFNVTEATSFALFDLRFGFYSEGNWKFSEATEHGSNPGFIRFARGIKDAPEYETELISPFSKRTATVGSSKLTLSSKQDEGQPSVNLTAQHRLMVLSDWEPTSAWVDDEDTVHCFDHKSGKQTRTRIGATVLGLSFSPKAPLLACRTEGAVTLIDLSSGRTRTIPFRASGQDPSPVAFSPDGEFMAMESVSGEPAVAVLADGGRMSDAAAEPDSSGFVDVMRLASPNKDSINQLAWSPTGSHLCVGTIDGYVLSWNLSLLRSQLRLYQLKWGSSTIPPQQTFVPIRRE